MSRIGPLVLVAAVTGCTLLNEYPAVFDADDGPSLREALRDAEPGDYVRITGVISGRFTVPPGVVVSGSDAGLLEGPSGAPALEVQGSTDPERPTVIQDLRLATNGGAGIYARGGHLLIQGVGVDAAERGVAILVDGAQDATLRQVRLAGDQSRDLFLTATDSVGLVVRATQRATLEDVEARYFGRASVALVDSSVSWQGGRATEGGRFGLLVHSSSVSLADVDASGLRGLIPEAGVLITGESNVWARRLTVSLGASNGLIQLGGVSRFEALQARGNGGVGVTIQDAESAELELLAERNFAVGLLALDVQRLRVVDTIVRQHGRSDIVEGSTSVAFGDGVELVRSFDDLRFQRSAIDTSFRVGLLLVADGAEILPEMFEDVRISGFEDQLGAIQQNGVADADWDRGILRSPSISANDRANDSLLVSLERLPSTVAELGEAIAANGLAELVTP